jgi:S1-C subfamily serine protease
VFAGSRPGALAQIVARDAEHDLAVLLVPKTLDSPPCLPVNPSPPAMGERVFTIGYPHIALQGQAPKFTDGTVSSLTGFMDEPSTLQVSVPVQSGNSGGPLLNSRGGVVGVVAAKLEAAKVFDWTGDLPQNVNYAIKATYVLRLLAPLQESAEGKVLATQAGPVEEVVRRVKDSVVLIVAE